MAVAFGAVVASGSATTSANTLVVTLTAGVAVGESVTVDAGSTGGATVTGIVDSKGNTYTVDSTVANGTGRACGLGSTTCTAALVTGDTITVTYSVASTARYARATRFTGMATNATRVGVTNSNINGTNTTAPTAGSLTPAEANDAIVAAGHNASTTAATAGAGFTLLGAGVAVGTGQGIGEYQIQTTATTVNPSWTTANVTTTAVDAAYRQAGVAASPRRRALVGVGV